MHRTILTVALGLVVIAGGRVDAHPPWGIAVDGRGRVVFADIDHGNHIWRIEAPGKLTSLVAGRHSARPAPGPRRDPVRLAHRVHPAGRTLREPAPEDRAGRRDVGGHPADDGPQAVLGQRLHARRRGQRVLRLHEQPAGRRGRGRVAAPEAEPGRPGHRPGREQGGPPRRQGQGGAVPGHQRPGVGTRAACCTSPTSRRSARWPGTGPSPRWPATWWRRDPARRSVMQAISSAWRSAPDGTAYAADHGVRRIVKVTPDGRISTAIDRRPAGRRPASRCPGTPSTSSRSAPAARGSRSGPRVRKVSPGGKSKVLATVAD